MQAIAPCPLPKTAMPSSLSLRMPAAHSPATSPAHSPRPVRRQPHAGQDAAVPDTGSAVAAAAVAADTASTLGGGFEGWFSSSLDMLRGLQVQPLRIDPRDTLWRELFQPA